MRPLDVVPRRDAKQPSQGGARARPGRHLAGDARRDAPGCVRGKRSGGSPDADAVLGLLEWAVEAGDDEKARWLEEELAATGKGAYLASLNSPGC